MKKVVILLLLCLCLGGCRGPFEGSVSSENSLPATTGTGIATEDTSRGSVETVQDTYTIFLSYIENNPIDAQYREDVQLGVQNTGDIVSAYLSGWKEELSFTLEHCALFMEEENYQRLSTEVLQWEQQILSVWQAEHTILFLDTSNAYGTQYYQEFRLKLAEQYRSMVIQLKYLCFTLETDLNPENFHSSLYSLAFHGSDSMSP